jgi:hypothetical protein
LIYTDQAGGVRKTRAESLVKRNPSNLIRVMPA